MPRVRRLQRPRRSETAGEKITVDNMPLPVWERAWSPNGSDTLQALYAIMAPNTPWVGVRITIHVDRGHHVVQSYATAEVFNGTMWNPIAGLHPLCMYAAQKVPSSQTLVRFYPEGARTDIATLLEDVRLAYALRAMGPDEYAERGRTVTTHTPVIDPERLAETMRASAKIDWSEPSTWTDHAETT